MKKKEQVTNISSAELTSLSRRKFLVNSIMAAGVFALAVEPINSQTRIVTDSKGLIVGEVKIPVSDGEIPAYRAMPEKGKSFPIVLVVHEIFGVHEWIQDISRRLAKLGFLAVAPYLYARQGDVSKLESIQEIFSKVVSKVPDSQVMSDLDATIAWAQKNKGSKNKVSITGFCWGGRIVWLYAARNPKIKAGAAWYGRLAPPQQPNPLQPKHPIDVAKDLKVPVIGLYGGKDRGIPLDTVEKMMQELKQGKSGSEIIVYPDADHGFLADYRPSYNKQASEDAWQKMLEWFKKNGAI
ncbi:MAG: dienelactone hydrolase family protein [Acidobacteria bacterium]|jgi:carboxymethylenebutenolidase|nr:MAG: dienelactone hydrolase family protein [Acidobacteriota bacterium]GIU82687.1 MAG: carboxymethylenebutenolidase [Pyrinomonadaceae bacterium]